METVITLLGGAAFVVFCFSCWKFNKDTTLKHYLYMSIASGVIFLGAGLLIGGNDKAQESQKVANPAPKVEVQKPAPPPAPPKIVNLGMTQAQFIQAFNNQAAVFGVADYLTIGATTDKTGVQNTFQFLFSQEVGIIGAVDPSTNLVKEVFILASPQTEDGLTAMLLAYGLISAVLNPELTQDQRGVLMQELKLTPDSLQKIKTEKTTTYRGNIRYVTQSFNNMFQLIASAKDL